MYCRIVGVPSKVLFWNSKAADFSLGDLGQTSAAETPKIKPVEDTPSTLVQPERTPIQADPIVEVTPSSRLEGALGESMATADAVSVFSRKLSKGYPEEIDCRQGLAGIRMRWCIEYKDLDRFRPPERNTLRPVWWFVLP